MRGRVEYWHVHELHGEGTVTTVRMPDPEQGFRGPYSVEIEDAGQLVEVGEPFCLVAALRIASRYARRYGADRVRITDMDRRPVE